MNPPPGSINRPDSGSTTLETVILIPALFAFIALIVFAGRVALARQAVEQAAWNAARQASIARNASDAQFNAVDRAGSLLEELGCQPNVGLDTSGFAIPAGQPATVTVLVSCTINLEDVALPGLPGTMTLSVSETTPLDRYRGRT